MTGMEASIMSEWRGCYNDSWQGVIVPDAFAHPAKFARGLIRRIYEHMLKQGYIAPGDKIVDPFGGVGLGGLDAMTLGLHWTGCELEPRFVELAGRNIEKWQRDLAMLNGTLGSARVLQGDSRRLAEVVGTAGGVVSSPPYDSNTVHSDSRAETRHDEKGGTRGRWGHSAQGNNIAQGDYGDTPGQLGHMSGGGFETMTDSESETFWSAARLIVEQTYAVLKPGGVAVWVCKDFVRGGRRVPFSDQWEQLCAAIGFESLERIQAMLVEEHAPQLDIFGGEFVKTVERKSFFRRLAERKGSPRIDWEDVLIMRKPGAAQ